MELYRDVLGEVWNYAEEQELYVCLKVCRYWRDLLKSNHILWANQPHHICTHQQAQNLIEHTPEYVSTQHWRLKHTTTFFWSLEGCPCCHLDQQQKEFNMSIACALVTYFQFAQNLTRVELFKLPSFIIDPLLLLKHLKFLWVSTDNIGTSKHHLGPSATQILPKTPVETLILRPSDEKDFLYCPPWILSTCPDVKALECHILEYGSGCKIREMKSLETLTLHLPLFCVMSYSMQELKDKGDGTIRGLREILKNTTITALNLHTRAMEFWSETTHWRILEYNLYSKHLRKLSVHLMRQKEDKDDADDDDDKPYMRNLPMFFKCVAQCRGLEELDLKNTGNVCNEMVGAPAISALAPLGPTLHRIRFWLFLINLEACQQMEQALPSLQQAHFDVMSGQPVNVILNMLSAMKYLNHCELCTGKVKVTKKQKAAQVYEKLKECVPTTIEYKMMLEPIKDGLVGWTNCPCSEEDCLALRPIDRTDALQRITKWCNSK